MISTARSPDRRSIVVAQLRSGAKLLLGQCPLSPVSYLRPSTILFSSFRRLAVEFSILRQNDQK